MASKKNELVVFVLFIVMCILWLLSIIAIPFYLTGEKPSQKDLRSFTIIDENGLKQNFVGALGFNNEKELHIKQKNGAKVIVSKIQKTIIIEKLPEVL